MKKIIILFFFLLNFACQPIEKIDNVVFDNNQFPKFEFLSKSIEIDLDFEKKNN